jgi:hypothetical protein
VVQKAASLSPAASVVALLLLYSPRRNVESVQSVEGEVVAQRAMSYRITVGSIRSLFGCAGPSPGFLRRDLPPWGGEGEPGNPRKLHDVWRIELPARPPSPGPASGGASPAFDAAAPGSAA